MNHLHFFLQSLIFILGISIPVSYSEDDPQYLVCHETYNCGLLGAIGYPFWGGSYRPQYCGHEEFALVCEDNEYPSINISGVKFRLLNISASISAITVVPIGIWGSDACPATYTVINTSVSHGLYSYAASAINLTLFYRCPSLSDEDIPSRNKFSCSINGYYSGDACIVDDSLLEAHRATLTKCEMNISAYVNEVAKEELWNGDEKLVAVLNQGFDVQYDSVITNSCSACQGSGGICGSSETTFGFSCLCPDHPYPQACPISGNFNRKNLVIGISCGIIGVIIVFIYCLRRRKVRKYVESNIEAFIRNYGTLAPKRYNSSDVKKMTNFYKEKLGRGGYGEVYKGNLRDGQLVAVKVLNASKGKGEEFINEVASISRTSHVNVVTLVGFCLESNKRALIYEFMPNGSLEKFISKESNILGWKKLYDISLGIARGLEYLHRGCNTRILHLDIKPQNILLDEEFLPKISDFGLSKLCTEKDSIVSMLEARGTIGYIAPEIFSRNFGAVSHKSDVYSYGMMVLEMVGGKKSDRTGVSASSEYFPDWIYRDLEVTDELEPQGLNSNVETDTKKKMILVALWCIQTIPSNRPSINKVIEMLEGSVEALQIPPKPYFSSPPRPIIPDSTATSSFDIVSLVE